MGGGQKVKQTNPQQAAAANAGATTSATAAQALGNQFNSQQQQLYNMLWGAPGNSGGGAVGGAQRGALSSFLDPKSLGVSSPTGVFALQNTAANNAAAKQYENNAGSIKTELAQQGFNPATTPSGFGADLLARNARALADTRGQNFLTSTTNQYQDALNNFWKAAQMTGQGAATGGQLANQATGTAANTYANLYGTAGHGNVTQNSNLAGNLIGAAGAVGASAVNPACVAEDTLIRMASGDWKKVQELEIGHIVLGLEAEECRVMRTTSSVGTTLKLVTDNGHTLQCSESHTLLVPGGGYVRAKDALGQKVMTMSGPAKIEAIERTGCGTVWMVELSGRHIYLSDGIWSEE